MHTTELDWSIEDVIKSVPKDPDKLLAYKLPPELQRRASELLALRKAGRDDDETRDEIERFLKLDSEIMELKARALRATRCGDE
jgi:hypothetical protein